VILFGYYYYFDGIGLKGIVHQKMKIYLAFTHPHVIPNPQGVPLP